MSNSFSLEDRIEQLLQFEAEHGHLFVPVKYKPNNLGYWVNNKRAAKKSNKKIDADTMAKLNEIGFVWVWPKGPEKDALIEWGKQFSWLVKFQKDQGHCTVPAKIAGKLNPVATWCDEQRRLNMEGKLDPAKVDKLTRLGFNFYGSSADDDTEDKQPVRISKDIISFLYWYSGLPSNTFLESMDMNVGPKASAQRKYDRYHRSYGNYQFSQ